MWWIRVVMMGALAMVSDVRAQPLACPLTISVMEQATAGAGWRSETKTQVRPLLRISVFNLDAKGTEYDLAPDNEKGTPAGTQQTWELKGYRNMKLVVRCRYRDTGATLSRELPAALTECRQTIRVDGKGAITKTSEVACR